MDILFITASRLGDAVLSAGILDHLVRAHPGARVTIVCGPVAAPVFDAVPGRVETIILKKRKYHKHWVDLWKRVAGTRWDIVVDLRDSAVSRLVRARERYVFGRHIDKTAHKVVQNAAVLGLGDVPGPRIWVSVAQEEKAAEILGPGEGPVLAVGPTANWIGKTWPVERFIEVVRRVTAEDGVLPGARVAVLAAPGEEAAAYELLRSVPEGRGIDVIAKCDPGVAAALLARCDFYIGNDSGLMHCAAAAGVRTLGLFGPSWPQIYAPWGEKAAWVGTDEDFAALTAFEGYDPKTLNRSLMTGLSVARVMEGVDGLCGK